MWAPKFQRDWILQFVILVESMSSVVFSWETFEVALGVNSNLPICFVMYKIKKNKMIIILIIMQTDKTTDYNRTDILLIKIQWKTALIIDIGVTWTHNIKKTEMEKQRKNKELAIQLKNIRKPNQVTIHPIDRSSIQKTFYGHLYCQTLPYLPT